MARINKTRFAILGALSHHPMSGYDIKKWVTEVTGSFWSESPGQVYPMLKLLLKDGLVQCDEKQGKGKRLKKIYRLTTKGKKSLKTWLELPVDPPIERSELCLKLFYGKNASIDSCINHLEKQKQKNERGFRLL